VDAGFSLGGNLELSVLAGGSPSSSAVSCPAGTPRLINEAGEGTHSGLNFGEGSNPYYYGWQTSAAWRAPAGSSASR
jgi:hypothetical protein